MMKQLTFAAGIVGLLLALTVGTAQAQYRMTGHWDANINTGVLMAEDVLFSGFVSENFDRSFLSESVEAAYHLSADVTYRFDNGVTLGAEGGWSPINKNRFILGMNGANELRADKLNLYLYSGDVGYVRPIGRAGIYGRVGVGGATLAIDRGTSGVTDQSKTYWHTPATIGGMIPLNNRLVASVMARDNIIYGQDSGTTHNWYFGAGVAVNFRGR